MIELFTSDKTPSIKKFGIPEAKSFATSFANLDRLEKGLSATRQTIDGSYGAYSRVVTAPMLLPNNPIYDIYPVFLR